MRAKTVTAFIKEANEYQIVGYAIICPGCESRHVVYVNPLYYNQVWTFNGDLNKPTFRASLLCTTGSYAVPGYIDDPAIPPTRCHSFITDGRIEYLTDCTHSLAGQTVDLPEFMED